MSNAIAARTDSAMQTAPDRGALVEVLGASLYPGAKPESIELVLSYCEAARLDPMQKPVHIVPMSVKVPGSGRERDSYEWRDVIMPGIGLYRVQAARTGQYAGCSEPEFGPTVEFDLGAGEDAVTVSAPEWCRVTVYRMVGGQRCEFSAREFWMENYATAGRKTTAPNAMWKRRPFGQLAKCAEAQALRKAFPEVGAQPTADEMEGKPYALDDGMTIAGERAEAEPLQRPRAVTQQRPETVPAEPPRAREPAPAPAAQRQQQERRGRANGDQQATGAPVCTAGQAKMLFARCKSHGVDPAALAEHFGVADLDSIPRRSVDEALQWIEFGQDDAAPVEGDLVDDFDPSTPPF